jgi:hypothetical protein
MEEMSSDSQKIIQMLFKLNTTKICIIQLFNNFIQIYQRKIHEAPGDKIINFRIICQKDAAVCVHVYNVYSYLYEYFKFICMISHYVIKFHRY